MREPFNRLIGFVNRGSMKAYRLHHKFNENSTPYYQAREI